MLLWFWFILNVVSSRQAGDGGGGGGRLARLVPAAGQALQAARQAPRQDQPAAGMFFTTLVNTIPLYPNNDKKMLQISVLHSNSMC